MRIYARLLEFPPSRFLGEQMPPTQLFLNCLHTGPKVIGE